MSSFHFNRLWAHRLRLLSKSSETWHTSSSPLGEPTVQFSADSHQWFWGYSHIFPGFINPPYLCQISFFRCSFWQISSSIRPLQSLQISSNLVHSLGHNHSSPPPPPLHQQHRIANISSTSNSIDSIFGTSHHHPTHHHPSKFRAIPSSGSCTIHQSVQLNSPLKFSHFWTQFCIVFPSLFDAWNSPFPSTILPNFVLIQLLLHSQSTLSSPLLQHAYLSLSTFSSILPLLPLLWPAWPHYGTLL